MSISGKMRKEHIKNKNKVKKFENETNTREIMNPELHM